MTTKPYQTPWVLRVMALFEKNILASIKAEGEDMSELSDPNSEFLGW